jgi:ATP-dependent DNA ligase
MTSFPEWIEPMAATLTYERFTGPEWIFERKLDGIRLLAFGNGGNVRLFSRNRLPKDIPIVAHAIADLPVSQVILDGELTWEGGAYHVFDLMWLDGRDVTSLPLVERQALLGALPLREPLERVAALEDPSPWERACRSNVHWVRPEIVVQVAFIEWTRHQKLRHPRLVGVREDKVAREVPSPSAMPGHIREPP